MSLVRAAPPRHCLTSLLQKIEFDALSLSSAFARLNEFLPTVEQSPYSRRKLLLRDWLLD